MKKSAKKYEEEVWKSLRKAHKEAEKLAKEWDENNGMVSSARACKTCRHYSVATCLVKQDAVTTKIKKIMDQIRWEDLEEDEYDAIGLEYAPDDTFALTVVYPFNVCNRWELDPKYEKN